MRTEVDSVRATMEERTWTEVESVRVTMEERMRTEVEFVRATIKKSIRTKMDEHIVALAALHKEVISLRAETETQRDEMVALRDEIVSLRKKGDSQRNEIVILCEEIVEIRGEVVLLRSSVPDLVAAEEARKPMKAAAEKNEPVFRFDSLSSPGCTYVRSGEEASATLEYSGSDYAYNFAAAPKPALPVAGESRQRWVGVWNHRKAPSDISFLH